MAIHLYCNPETAKRGKMINIDVGNKKNFYRLLVGIAAVVFILIGCLLILAPFIPAILLGTILALSTWPAFTWLNQKLKYRTTLSSVLMCLLLATCFIIPLIIIGTSTADNFGKIYTSAQSSIEQNGLDAITQFVAKVPVVGEPLAKYADTFVSDREKLRETMHQYAAPTTQNLLKFGGALGQGLMDLCLGVFIAYFFFRYGTRVAVRVSGLIDTFGGEKGQEMLEVCKHTLIGVVYGLLGTAFAQGALCALGFWIAQVPGASFLGLLVFFMSVTPIGPPLIWVPVAFWLYTNGSTSMAIFLVIWCGAGVGLVDNIIRPYFISRANNVPFLLVLFGVIGGMIAFGFIGVFIGPTLLALAYTLMLSWSGETPQKPARKAVKKAK